MNAVSFAVSECDVSMEIIRSLSIVAVMACCMRIRSAIAIARSATLVVLVLFLSSMARPPSENVLVLAGTRLNSGEVHEIPFENPAVAGYVRLDSAPSFETLSSGEHASCCSRITVVADRNVFVYEDGRRSNSNLGFIPEQTPTDGFWRFETGTLALPTDGGVVTLRIMVDGNFVTSPRRVRLKSKTLVLPVHVHIFKAPGVNISGTYERAFVFDWLDPGAVRIRAFSHHDPVLGVTDTTVISQRQSKLMLPPDVFWQVAGVQFRLESYEIIEQRDGLERNLFSLDEAAQPLGGACRHNTRFWPYHRARQDTAGIHFYVGGQIPSNMLLEDRVAGTCGPFTSPCRIFSDCDDFIVWDAGARGTEFALLHELGHYLGLGHPGESFQCPPGVEIDGPNFMHPRADQL